MAKLTFNINKSKFSMWRLVNASHGLWEGETIQFLHNNDFNQQRSMLLLHFRLTSGNCMHQKISSRCYVALSDKNVAAYLKIYVSIFYGTGKWKSYLNFSWINPSWISLQPVQFGQSRFSYSQKYNSCLKSAPARKKKKVSPTEETHVH